MTATGTRRAQYTPDPHCGLKSTTESTLLNIMLQLSLGIKMVNIGTEYVNTAHVSYALTLLC